MSLCKRDHRWFGFHAWDGSRAQGPQVGKHLGTNRIRIHVFSHDCIVEFFWRSSNRSVIRGPLERFSLDCRKGLVLVLVLVLLRPLVG